MVESLELSHLPAIYTASPSLKLWFTHSFDKCISPALFQWLGTRQWRSKVAPLIELAVHSSLQLSLTSCIMTNHFHWCHLILPNKFYIYRIFLPVHSTKLLNLPSFLLPTTSSSTGTGSLEVLDKHIDLNKVSTEQKGWYRKKARLPFLQGFGWEVRALLCMVPVYSSINKNLPVWPIILVLIPTYS